MQVLQVPEKSVLVNHSCVGCDRKIRAGQWIVYVQQGTSLLRKTLIHVTCLRILLIDVPDEDEEAFEDLRHRILATGQAFPT
jgi:hypothetical protein